MKIILTFAIKNIMMFEPGLELETCSVSVYRDNQVHQPNINVFLKKIIEVSDLWKQFLPMKHG